MRTLALLAALTILALAFAGCSGGDKDGDGTTTSSSTSGTASASGSSSTSKSSTSTTSASGTTSSGPAVNQPPTGSVSASINGTNATFSLTGSDPDSDPLTWELDFGDGSPKASGTELPSTAKHPYAMGNYTVNFTLTDGKASASYDVNITVAAAGGASTGQVFVGEWTAPVSACGGPYDSWTFGTPAAGVAWAEVAVDPSTIGRPYTAVFAPDQAAPAVSFFSMDFYDDADAIVAGGSFVFDPGREVAGTVPAGAVNIMFASCFAAPVTVTYTTA